MLYPCLLCSGPRMQSSSAKKSWGLFCTASVGTKFVPRMTNHFPVLTVGGESQPLFSFFATLCQYRQTGGVLGPLKWTSNPMAFPFAVQETAPMVIAISHDVKTKEGFVSLAAKLNSNFDGKLMLPSQGNPVATLVGSHRYSTTLGMLSNLAPASGNSK